VRPAVVLIDAAEAFLDAAACPMTSLLDRRSRGSVLHRPLDLRSVPRLRYKCAASYSRAGVDSEEQSDEVRRR
jgi:hypothetical protein